MPEKKGFRYVYAPSQILTMLKKIQSTGRPDVLTFKYIKSTWLLKNKQYGAVLVLLKDMNLLDANNKPTQLYAKYQNEIVAKSALAEGVRNAYPQLFKAFPNASALPRKELEGYFKEQTGKSGLTLDKIVSTFTTLCGLADFTVSTSEKKGPLDEETLAKERDASPAPPTVSLEPNIQVNIGINIAPDTPDDKIELIFKNMRKYLLQKPNGEANK